MDNISTSTLLIVLAALVVVSAFFSAAETSLISLNRYRLRHLVRAKHAGAMRAPRLLEKPDRCISFILVGNNIANIAASVGKKSSGSSPPILARTSRTSILKRMERSWSTGAPRCVISINSWGGSCQPQDREP